jgi:hypothetical protein
MGLPTCSIRALPEHHQLLRRIGRALVTRPDLSGSLEALIDGVTQDVTRQNTAWDQRFEDVERRLARLEAEAVLRSETQTVLPQRVTRNTPPQHGTPAVTRQPRQTSAGRGAGGGNRLTAEQDRQIAEMLNAGRPYSEIAASVGVSIGGLTKIKARLAEQGLLTAKPAKDEAREGQPHLSIDEMTAIPDEHSEQASLYQIAGMTFAQVIELKGWTWEADDLAAAVERWREKHPPQAMLPIEWTRQVAAMQHAGRSPDEIMAWLAQQRANFPPVT